MNIWVQPSRVSKNAYSILDINVTFLPAKKHALFCYCFIFDLIAVVATIISFVHGEDIHWRLF